MTAYGRTHRLPVPASAERRVPLLRRPPSLDGPVLAGALGLSLLLAVATVSVPTPLLLPGVALAAGIVVLGPELLIVAALLAATGFLPFTDPNTAVLPGVKGYFFFSFVAAATMILTWGARVVAGRPAWPLKANLLLALLLGYLCYVGLLFAATDPLAQPTLAAPFVEFPMMALATYLWLSHEDAITGLKRVLPLAVIVVVAWTLLYVAGAGGCEGCQRSVTANLYVREGLLGPESRLYTAGQYSLLALVLVAFGQALRRPTPLTVSLAALGLVCVAAQSFRAAYFGVAAGMIVLIAWRLRASGTGGRLALGALATIGFVALLLSPVGERALTAYEELRAGTGTPGYRAELYDQASENWSLVGAGVTGKTLSLGVNQDIGVASTFIVVGLIGGALQFGVLLLAFVRGVRVRTLAGATIAAVFMLVIVTRASLPLMELGHSPITYGAAVGVAAWLVVPSGRPGHSVRREQRRPWPRT